MKSKPNARNIEEMDASDYLEWLRRSTQLCDFEQVERAIDKMAALMTKKLKDSHPIILAVMNSAVVLAGQLLPKLKFPLQFDTLQVSRYRGGKEGGNLSWVKEPSIDLENREVVILDDLIDEGITLHEIMQYCEKKGAKSVYTAVLMEKNIERKSHIKKANFVGLSIPDEFLVGFGMDYKDYFRNAPGVYILNPEIK